jgi:Uma2 family endonuclease
MPVASPTRRNPTESERPILLDGISWETYSAILHDYEDRNIFLTYDRGRLEIMSPSFRHEIFGRLIASMITILADELEFPNKGGKSTTFRKQELHQGLEPDECSWIANEPALRGRYEFDPEVDPPPDLAIEIEISHRALDRLSIFAALGVPEIWRCDGDRLIIEHRRDDGTYLEVPHCLSLPMLPKEQVLRFLRLYETMSETAWRRAFRDWVRAEALPGLGGQASGG